MTTDTTDTTGNPRTPALIVQNDYEGYFGGVVQRWIDRKAEKGGTFRHEKVIVTAGPWRSYAVSYTVRGNEIHLDFYSALRNGFGNLDEKEVTAIIDLL